MWIKKVVKKVGYVGVVVLRERVIFWGIFVVEILVFRRYFVWLNGILVFEVFGRMGVIK